MRQLNLLFFLLFSITAFAQSIEFAPPGATWKYVRSQFTFGGIDEEFRTLTYIEDDVIDGKPCKTLAGDGLYYVYQEDDKVYYRHSGDTSFFLLWDFGIMPGESYEVFFHHPMSFEGLGLFTCTGRDTIFINGMKLPVIFLDMSCNSGQDTYYSVAVNPRFGPIIWGQQLAIPFVIPDNPGCIIDGWSYQLCAYRDNELGVYHTGDPNFCTIVSVEEPIARDVVVAPNPATDQVTIQLPNDLSGEVLTAQLTDLTGRVVLEQNISAPVSTLAIPAHRCATGLYLLQIKGEKSRFKTQKLHLNGE